MQWGDTVDVWDVFEVDEGSFTFSGESDGVNQLLKLKKVAVLDENICQSCSIW